MLTVDLDVDGRQHGFLALAHPGSPFERRRVPLSVLRRGEGPCIALVATAGGDEDRASGAGDACANATGALALQRLARELDPTALVGTVVLVPGVPAAARASLGRHVLARADAVLEIAAPAAGLAFAPSAAIRADTDPATRERAEAMMIAFGAPDSARLAPAFAGGALDGVLGAAVPHVRATLDGVAAPADALDIALAGCRNALVEAGVLDAPFALRATRMLEVRDATAVVQSPADGLLEPRARAAHAVYRGNPLALLVDPSRSGAAPIAIPSPRDGIVLALRHGARVRAGDTLAVVAEEMPR